MAAAVWGEGIGWRGLAAGPGLLSAVLSLGQSMVLPHFSHILLHSMLDRAGCDAAAGCSCCTGV